MSVHFIKQVERLKAQAVALAAVVEEDLRRAVKSVDERDPELAERVIKTDREIDHKEVDIEEECLKILVLYQPVAIDLRLVVGVLKMNSDLERIGDLAVNIAERARYLTRKPRPEVALEFARMEEKVRGMLKGALDALVNLDCKLARQVCADDDEVDAMNREMYGLVKNGIRRNPSVENIEILIHMLSVSRHLERVADHATNIAEDVIYMIEGEIVRHRTEEYRTQAQQADGPSGQQQQDSQ